MSENLLPADVYTVINQTIFTEYDKKIVINLYEPIIGPVAVSMYLTFLSDLDKSEFISRDYNHHHLMTILKTSLKDIQIARKSLEAVGLLKTFIKKDESVNEYIYELYSPVTPTEFFNHPVFSVLLLNNIGEMEYKYLLNYYKKLPTNKSGYEEITASMDTTFISTTSEIKEENIRKQNRIGMNLNNLIDFDLIESTLPKGMINSKTFNKRVRELINQLAFIYNLDSFKMSDIIKNVIDEFGNIDKDKLRNLTRKNYEHNNNGSLPTIVYRIQPDYLKTPVGNSSNRAKMIYVFENTKPYDFLRGKNRGIKPTSRDLKLLEHLAVDFALPPGVVNVLVDYAIKVNDGKLNPKYLETIASDWSRKGVKTVPDAMEVASKGHKRVVKAVHEEKPKVQVKAPSWLFEDNKSETMSEEELKELENMFEEFR